MKISEHANYLLNEYGRLQFDYAAYCKPYGESLRNEARNNLEEYIAELEDAQRWVPVSERLPENISNVLILSRGEQLIASYHSKYSLWYVPFVDKPVVTHWMPLPELPEVQE